MITQFRYLLVLAMLWFDATTAVAQLVRVPVVEESIILSHGFYKKTMQGLQPVNQYVSGDSSFYIVLNLEPVDYTRKVNFLWYFMEPNGDAAFIDSIQIDFPGEVGAYTGSLTRSGLLWESGSYKVAVQILDSSRAMNKEEAEFLFEVVAEPVPEGFFINPMSQSKSKLETWDAAAENMMLLLAVDSVGIEGKKELETYWFFIMPEEEPLSIHQSYYELDQLKEKPRRTYLLNIPYSSPGGWPQGMLLVEVWVDQKLVRFLEIEVL